MSFVLIAPFSLQLNCGFLRKEGVYCLIGNLMLNVLHSSVFYVQFLVTVIVSGLYLASSCYLCYILVSSQFHYVMFILPKRLSFSFYIHSLLLVPSVAILLKHLTCVLHMTLTTCVLWCHPTALLPVLITSCLEPLGSWTGLSTLYPVCFQGGCMAYDHVCIWPVRFDSV